MSDYPFSRDFPMPPIDGDIITNTTLFARQAELPEGVGLTGSVDPEAPDHNPLRKLRVSLLVEEVNETLLGEQGNDPVEIADGLADTIVIAWGSLLTYFGEEAGIEVLREVWRSNLSKVDGSLGEIKRRDDGKLLKPEGWTPPDVAGVLRRHGFLPLTVADLNDDPDDATGWGLRRDENARADDPEPPTNSSIR